MKTLKYIENMSFEELETISGDQSVEVPAGLHDNLEDTVLAAAVAEGKEHRSVKSYKAGLFALAASVACAAILLVGPARPRTPKDTFSSPELAYAELERTVNLISRKMDAGMDMSSDKIQYPINAINEIMDKIK